MGNNSDNNNKSQWYKKFWYNHPIICNGVIIVLSLLILSQLTMWFLDVWTHHGSKTVVPNVVGMDFNRAVTTLNEADLDVVVSDSVYRKDLAPGSVVEVIPRPDAIVKAGREVYITIVAFSPETVTLDANFTDMSFKQAEAILKSRGLKVEKRYVPYQFDDIVVNIKCNGRNLSLGSKVSVEDVIILEVGQIPAQTPTYTTVADVPQPEKPKTESLDTAIDAAIASDGHHEAEETGEKKESPEFGLKKKEKKDE